MFDQQNGQNNQQQNFQDVNAPGQPAPAMQDDSGHAQNPAAPAPAQEPDQQQPSPPQPAYESIFDETGTNDGSLSADDGQQPVNTTAQTPPPAQEPDQHIAPTTPPADTEADAANGEELISIKKQALEHLSPLVGQLEQTPEEKFHTTMRIIQASDNHTLLKEAYEAAQNIEDDKARAQALLDIVNEINYFTNGADAQGQEEPKA